MSATLTLAVHGRDAVTFTPSRLVVAGYTGRDRAAVQHHIDELAALGVPPPPSVPMFYELPPDLLTSAPRIDAAGPSCSGEVEPVLARVAGEWLLTAGSDHTDRDLETVDIAASKAACAKPIGAAAVSLADIVSRWDDGTLRSWVDGQPYQDASMARITPPLDLLARAEAAVGPFGDGVVLFLGTVPLLGPFAFGARFRAELELSGAPLLTCSYESVMTKEQPA